MRGNGADRDVYARARAACDDTRAALAESKALLEASQRAIEHSRRLIRDCVGVRDGSYGATSSESSISLPLVQPAVCKVTHATK